MVDVFISYSRENKARVARIAEAVVAEGYDLWWDADLPPHRSYAEVIQDKIGSAKAVIVAWSASAAASEWVRAEADLARGQRKLIQTALDDVTPPLPFNQIQVASLADWNGEADHPGWRKVKASLADLVGSAPTPPVRPDPAPPPPPAKGGHGMLIAILAVLLIVLVGGLGYTFLQRDESEPAVVPPAMDNMVTADKTEDLPPVGPPDLPVAQGASPAARFGLTAVIEDPDGYVNVRTGPAATAPVIGRIEDGQEFRTHVQPGQWWQVRTAGGIEGYVHRSRIRRPGAPAVASEAPRMIFADSDRRRLDEAEIAALSPSEIRVARNEIFARRGRAFKSPELQAYFSRYPWYRPVSFEVSLNAVEQANVTALQRAEQGR